MAIVQVSGPVKCVSRVKTASTALSLNSLCTYTSGRLVAAASSTLVFAGILPRAVVSTDSDYASASPTLLVDLSAPEATFLMLCGSGASATTHVGNSYDLSDAVTLNLSGTSYKQFTVVSVVDDTHVIVRPNFAVITCA